MRRNATLPIPVAICGALDTQIRRAVASGNLVYVKLDSDAAAAIIADLRTRYQASHDRPGLVAAEARLSHC